MKKQNNSQQQTKHMWRNGSCNLLSSLKNNFRLQTEIDNSRELDKIVADFHTHFFDRTENGFNTFFHPFSFLAVGRILNNFEISSLFMPTVHTQKVKIGKIIKKMKEVGIK